MIKVECGLVGQIVSSSLLYICVRNWSVREFVLWEILCKQIGV